MNHSDLHREMTRALETAGISSPGVEARALLCAAAGIPYCDYPRIAADEAAPPEEAAARTLLRKRLDGCPAAYLCGTWEFYGLELTVTPAVLIPRVDTETLAEEGCRLANGAAEILDLCCGSGCVGVAVAKATGAHAVFSDISPEALAVAEKNAKRHLPAGSFETERRDALSPRTERERFDVILCNPPYVTEAEYAELSPEVREHEPRSALVAPEEGLYFYRRIPSGVYGSLRSGGALAFECGAGQAAAVEKLLGEAGYAQIRIQTDSAGIPRVVSGRKPFTSRMETERI